MGDVPSTATLDPLTGDTASGTGTGMGAARPPRSRPGVIPPPPPPPAAPSPLLEWRRGGVPPPPPTACGEVTGPAIIPVLPPAAPDAAVAAAESP